MIDELTQITDRGENFVVLGRHGRDEYRILVRPSTDEQEEAMEQGTVERIYPCRTCWWNQACGRGGEDCHS